MSSPRRAKKMVTAAQKYDLWLRMLTGQVTTVQAATEAGVDRSTIITLRKVARDGAIAALTASRPGRRKLDRVEQSELARSRAKIELSVREQPHRAHQAGSHEPNAAASNADNNAAGGTLGLGHVDDRERPRRRRSPLGSSRSSARGHRRGARRRSPHRPRARRRGCATPPASQLCRDRGEQARHQPPSRRTPRRRVRSRLTSADR